MDMYVQNFGDLKVFKNFGLWLWLVNGLNLIRVYVVGGYRKIREEMSRLFLVVHVRQHRDPFEFVSSLWVCWGADVQAFGVESVFFRVRHMWVCSVLAVWVV